MYIYMYILLLIYIIGFRVFFCMYKVYPFVLLVNAYIYYMCGWVAGKRDGEIERLGTVNSFPEQIKETRSIGI